MTRQRLIALLGGSTFALLLMGFFMWSTPATGTTVTVYKSPSCGCCTEWVDHLQANGFDVKVIKMNDMQAIKAEHGVAPHLSSCHTALVGGYVVEGHVPADLVQKMLRERPEIAGLTVPGMPVGAPGMEVAGQPAQAYDVLAFDAQGRTAVYARR